MALLATSPADGSILYGTTPTFINTSILSRRRVHLRGHGAPGERVPRPADRLHAGRQSVQLAGRGDRGRQANPGQQRWGVSTPGSLDRQVMEKMKALTETDVIIVTHEGGGDLLINVLNGTLDVGVGEIQELVGQIEAGEIKLLATYTERAARDVPRRADRARAGHRSGGRQVPRPRRPQGPARGRDRRLGAGDSRCCSRIPSSRPTTRKAAWCRRS